MMRFTLHASNTSFGFAVGYNNSAAIKLPPTSPLTCTFYLLLQTALLQCPVALPAAMASRV